MKTKIRLLSIMKQFFIPRKLLPKFQLFAQESGYNKTIYELITKTDRMVLFAF